jgi:hypothetical protein
MTIRTSKQAIAVASGQTKNVPGTCQFNVRTWFNADAAGDQDGDGDSDAVDGWLSEPRSARHEGDRNPPPGKPLAFKGGSRGFGHRALSTHNGVISTDMLSNRYSAGHTSTVTGSSTAAAIAQIESSMGVQYLGWSETIDGEKIPADPSEPKPPPVEVLGRRFAHISLEFSDGSKQHTADIEKVFNQGYHYITGTEAGNGAGNTRSELERCAQKFGYLLATARGYDTWVAIRKSFVVDGTWKTGTNKAFSASSEFDPKPRGTWGTKGVVWAEFRDQNLGVISIGSIHPITAKAAGVEIKKQTDALMMTTVEKWGAKHGKGTLLAFIGGDINKNDKKLDVFLKAPFTTCWDELKVWPSTGHGTIDVIASYDDDARVRCLRARAHDDTDFFLNTDHFLITADYEIQVLPRH